MLTFSIIVSDDGWTYLPSQDQICRGGYEVWQFRYANTYKMVDNADDCIVAENLKILKKAYLSAILDVHGVTGSSPVPSTI